MERTTVPGDFARQAYFAEADVHAQRLSRLRYLHVASLIIWGIFYQRQKG